MSTATNASVRAAITAGLETLLETMNKVELQCDFFDLGYFDSTLKALETYQQSIAALVANVARRRNRLLPVHQLPTEIFVRILQLATGLNSDRWHFGPSKLHTVAQVSVHWRNVILTSPFFWRVVSDGMDERLQAAVLRLNPHGPLTLWTKADQTDVADAFLERLMRPLAHRWQIVISERPYSDALLNHLQHLPPTLKDLTIRLYDHFETCFLPLAEGQPLRHVDLVRVCIPWDCSRLRNLKTLSLHDLDASQPSVGQIVSILSASPQLWRIAFQSWRRHRADDRADSQDLERYRDVVIALPSLKTLVLEDISPDVMFFLISHIQTATLSCFRAWAEYPTIVASIAHSGSMLRNMVDQALSSCCVRTTEILHNKTSRGTEIRSRPESLASFELVYWAKDSPGIDITVPTRVGSRGTSMLPLLADVLATNAPCVSLDLVGDEDPLVDQGPEEEWGSPPFPLAVLPQLGHIEYMSFSNEFNAGPMLRHLGAPTRGIRGETTWLCPELSFVRIESMYDDDVDLVVADILAFTRLRYPEWRDGVDGLDGPRASGIEDVLMDQKSEGSRVGGQGNEDNDNEASSSNTGRYPVMLKRLTIPGEVLARLRAVREAQYLDEWGILARSSM